MSINIRIDGLDKLNSKFNRFSPMLKTELNKAILKSAYEIERETKPITPVDTGRLRSSIRKRISNLEAVISPTTKYAIFVHEGTRRWPLRISPKVAGTVRQFLKEGAKRATPRIHRYFKDALRITVERS